MSWLQHDTIHKDDNSIMIGSVPLRWHHNGYDGVSNHQPHDCLLNQLFRRSSKKTSKLRVTGLCVGNSPGTGEFPAQMASNAENVSISWRHHALSVCRSHLVITIITIGPVILAYFSQNAGALHLFCFHFRQAWLLLILIGIWESGDHSGLWAQPMRHNVTLKLHWLSTYPEWSLRQTARRWGLVMEYFSFTFWQIFTPLSVRCWPAVMCVKLIYFTLLDRRYIVVTLQRLQFETDGFVCLWIIHMMTSSNGNIVRVTGHLCGEFTGPGEFPAQRQVARSFDIFFDLRPNKRLSKQPWGWWFETPSWSLWRHCNEMLLIHMTILCEQMGTGSMYGWF